jgi:hypothetical protein
LIKFLVQVPNLGSGDDASRLNLEQFAKQALEDKTRKRRKAKHSAVAAGDGWLFNKEVYHVG